MSEGTILYITAVTTQYTADSEDRNSFNILLDSVRTNYNQRYDEVIIYRTIIHTLSCYNVYCS